RTVRCVPRSGYLRPLPGELRRLVPANAILDDEHGLDSVETTSILAEKLPLHGSGDLVALHQLQRFPYVLGVVVRIVGRPERDVLIVIPHPVHRLLVALERDEAMLAKRLVGIANLGCSLERVEVEE